MKKYLFLVFILFTSGKVAAQIDKIVGNWSETTCVRTDTLDSGRAEINKDYQAYVKGTKRLDPELHTQSYSVTPDEDAKLKLNILKQGDFFWATDGKTLKEKIIYEADFKEYMITIKKHFTSYSYIIKYDAESDNLLFLNYQSKDISSAFERKK